MRAQIPVLDDSGLRQFAFKMAAVIAPLFGLLLPWLFGFGFPWWPWIVGAALVVWGAVAPRTLKPVYRGWMVVGLAVGAFNSRVILGLMFYLVILPAGLLRRLFGDPLNRKRDPGASSYRVTSRRPAREHLEKPY